MSIGIELLNHLSPETKEELRKVCIQIDELLGHTKDEKDRRRLAALFKKRKEIIERIDLNDR